MQQQFKTFSGLDYLKIDIANSAGKDKLLFEERIIWFNNNIPESVVTLDNQELAQFVDTFTDCDSKELLYTGLLTYQDYWHKRPSGYMCQLDAVCSGASLMSALMADLRGLDHTGLITERRGDLYKAVYERFKQICEIPTTADRQHIKDLVMQFLYGSKKVIKDTAMAILGYNHSRLKELPPTEQAIVNTVMEKLCTAINLEANGAYQLQTSLISNWDSTTDTVHWIMPDGFNVCMDNIVDKQYEYKLDNLVIPYTIKEKGTIKKSVSNCANQIHSCDGMIIRELTRRCMFNESHIQEALFYLTRVPDNVFELPSKIETKLDELVVLYESSKFTSIRIVEYINSLQDACKLSKSHRTKLIDILDLMLKQGTFEMVAIHDCVKALPNKMNYLRYWYKEIIADIVDSNLLVFLHNQLPNKIKDPITSEYRKAVANHVRNSNYGIC